MNRGQMIAHLILHGWEPMKYLQAWRGVLKEDLLIYVRIDDMSPRGVHVAKAFDDRKRVEDCRAEWEHINPKVLRECYQHIMENGL